MGSNVGRPGPGRGPDLIMRMDLYELKRVQESGELLQRETSAPRMCQDMPDESSQPGLESSH